MGPRARGPFVVFDCTAVPPNLVESELFGHERGAFTGAVAPRGGASSRRPHGGTLLIDEIGELDVALQPKLLRALERSEVQRVGIEPLDHGRRAHHRGDAARSRPRGPGRPLPRRSLLRLAVGRVELPPLRRRKGDVDVLAEHFWQALGGAAMAAAARTCSQRFEDYRWPGNVRELHNAVARVLALGDDAARDMGTSASSPGAALDVSAAAAGDVIEQVLGAELPLTRAREAVVSEFERRYVERVLARHGGNVVRAAEASGIARRYFQILRARHKPQ